MSAEDYGISSAHVTFNGEEEWKSLSDLGFLQRAGIQYHWENPGYSSFDDFLSYLKQSKRKNIKQVGAKPPSSTDPLGSLLSKQAQGANWHFCFGSTMLRSQERKAVASSGLKVRRLTGNDLKPSHWNQFYEFYRNTTGQL